MWFSASHLYVQVSVCCLILLRELKWGWHHHYAPRCSFMGHVLKSSFHLDTCHWYIYVTHFTLRIISFLYHLNHHLFDFSHPEMIHSVTLGNFTIRISLSHSVSKQLWCRRLWRSSATGKEGASHGNCFSSHWPCDHNSVLYCTLHHGTHLHTQFNVSNTIVTC